MDKTTTFDADTRQLVHRYRSTKEKITRTSRHIAFNQLCLKQNITPNYAKINLKNTSYPAKQTKQTAEKLFIKNNIKHLYHQKNIHNQTAYNLHQKLARKLHHTQLEEILLHTTKTTAELNKTLTLKHNKKLKTLKEKQKVTYITNQKFYPRTHNNTNVHFNHNEIELLNKGLKHNLKPNTNNKNQSINEILDLETAIQKTKPEHQENLRQTAKKHIHHPRKHITDNRQFA